MPTRRWIAVPLLLCLCALPACKRRRPPVQQTEEEPAQLASVVHVADPRVSSQLVSGFYNVEQNTWRWTASRFTVLLHPPLGAAKRGALLQLKFVIPDAVIAKLKTMSLGATIDKTTLSRESYTQAGEFTYSREVSGDVLSPDVVKVTFDLDKWLPPGAADARELGVIVTLVGLEVK